MWPWAPYFLFMYVNITRPALTPGRFRVFVVVVVVCFIQRPSKYIETTHITTFGRKKGNSDKTRTVKACNIQPYNKFKN